MVCGVGGTVYVGLVFMWRKKEESKLREMTKIVIDVVVLKDQMF